MRNDRDNLIVRLTFELALDVVSFSERIREDRRYEMASQIFRSGTLEQILGKLKMQRVKKTSSINLKFLQKKLMNLNIG